MARITHVLVDKLLDYFDHEIRFPSDWNYILLYGPNGVGKTKLLEMIYAIYNANFDEVAIVPFVRIEIGHDDGTLFVVERSEVEETGLGKLNFKLRQPGKPVIDGEYYDTGGAELRRELLAQTSWRPIGGTLWRDESDGETVEWEYLSERYPYAGARRRRGRQVKNSVPQELVTFVRESPVHLIATQRLLYEDVPTFQQRNYVGSRGPGKVATIAAYSTNLKQQLSTALGENSKRTQQLDRSFPKRLLDMREQDIGPEIIRRRYQEQSQKRKDLAEIGLINAETDVPLPNRDLSPWELNVLHTYLDDTDEKLRTFDHVVARVTLLREIANSRFLNKTLSVNTEDGIVITRTSDGKTIPPANLSSGEQHELVLMYDLLFNVPASALVLIDEPEISLHVAWQKSFIKDIDSIAQLASLRFIIATHSPQIINKSWSQTVALGPQDFQDNTE
jgi:ABC-type lipoprotein export system ATPase subunit